FGSGRGGGGGGHERGRGDRKTQRENERQRERAHHDTFRIGSGSMIGTGRGGRIGTMRGGGTEGGSRAGRTSSLKCSTTWSAIVSRCAIPSAAHTPNVAAAAGSTIPMVRGAADAWTDAGRATARRSSTDNSAAERRMAEFLPGARRRGPRRS